MTGTFTKIVDHVRSLTGHHESRQQRAIRIIEGRAKEWRESFEGRDYIKRRSAAKAALAKRKQLYFSGAAASKEGVSDSSCRNRRREVGRNLDAISNDPAQFTPADPPTLKGIDDGKICPKTQRA